MVVIWPCVLLPQSHNNHSHNNNHSLLLNSSSNNKITKCPTTFNSSSSIQSTSSLTNTPIAKKQCKYSDPPGCVLEFDGVQENSQYFKNKLPFTILVFHMLIKQFSSFRYEQYEEYGGSLNSNSNNGSHTPHYGGSDPGYDSTSIMHMQQQQQQHQQQQQQIEMERRLSLQQQHSQSHIHQVCSF